MWVAFKATHIFFSKKFQHICVAVDVNFNESLTNDLVSFEQLGPELKFSHIVADIFSALFCFFSFSGAFFHIICSWKQFSY